MGVDTGGTAREFIIEPGGAPCRVTELTQDSGYSVSLGGSPGPVSTPCRVASVTGSGVTIVWRRVHADPGEGRPAPYAPA